MNPNERKISSREVSKEVHTDPQTNASSSTTRTTESVENTSVNNPVDATKKAAYHDGYVHGQVIERNRGSEGQEVRENNTAARALLLGIILTSLAGLVGGTLYLQNQRDREITPAPAIVVPKVIQSSPSPIPTKTIERETTIIEKPVPVPQEAPTDRIVPIPQQPSSPPDINITVPNSQTQQAPAQTNPAPQPTPAQSSAPDINITVPNSQQEPPSSPETPAAVEKLPTPSPKLSDEAPKGEMNNQTDTPTPSQTGAGDATAPNNNSGANDTTAPSGNSDTGGGAGSAP